MKSGAFAFLDCLGFKGIWQRVDPRLVLKKLTGIQGHYLLESAKDSASFSLIRCGLIRTKVLCLSDSIAISLTFDEEIHREKGLGDFHLIGAISTIVSTIIDSYLRTKPHLILRGCITFGEHAIEENFMIGPAVDDAVENERKADGAFIWFTRVAEELRTQFDDHMSGFTAERNDENPCIELVTEQELHQLKETEKIFRKFGPIPSVIRNYSMPITKERPNIECSIMNPLATCTSPRELDEKIGIYQTVMISDREDVNRKRRNTEAFLLHCKETTERYRSSVAQYLTNFGNNT